MHILRLHPEPFEAIKSGKKTSELRLNDSKRQLMKIGDEIAFISRTTTEEIKFTIKELNYYNDFYDAYSKIESSKIYPLDKLSIKERVDYMAEFYSDEDTHKYGVLEIVIG